jgi:hypothetical protein
MLSDIAVWLSAIAIIVALVGFIAWDSRNPSTCLDLAMHYQVFPELWFYLHEMQCPDVEHAEAGPKDAQKPRDETAQVSALFTSADLRRDLAVNTSSLDSEPG